MQRLASETKCIHHNKQSTADLEECTIRNHPLFIIVRSKTFCSMLKCEIYDKCVDKGIRKESDNSCQRKWVGEYRLSIHLLMDHSSVIYLNTLVIIGFISGNLFRQIYFIKVDKPSILRSRWTRNRSLQEGSDETIQQRHSVQIKRYGRKSLC